MDLSSRFNPLLADALARQFTNNRSGYQEHMMRRLASDWWIEIDLFFSVRRDVFIRII
ncbi:hypothetical protein [Symmachiella dynata]|uniref:hypothetical protein n=1 Tax=Symmachiella dynata TaxID=2527995 RepID=UPI0018D47F66|nr:hypothetical protein [Symmachiella dynata]